MLSAAFVYENLQNDAGLFPLIYLDIFNRMSYNISVGIDNIHNITLCDMKRGNANVKGDRFKVPH